MKKDYDVPFYITCDASTTQLGAVLIPKTAGIDRVIGYASPGLPQTFRKKSSQN